MTGSGITVSTAVDVPFDPSESFEILFDELLAALDRRGYHAKDGSDGEISQGDRVVGRVGSWEPGKHAVFEWSPTAWTEETTEVAIQFEAIDKGTRITLEHRGWGQSIEDPKDLVGWFAMEVATPFIHATAPDGFGDWLTDRQARKPSGPPARRVYSDPLYHYPNFRVILDELALNSDDYLLEVGCGGGALLEGILETGCRAAGVDHSPDMVETTRRNNRDAVEAGRLEVHEASAEDLPFPAETFTCATMTGVLGFLPDPVGVLTEIRRVLESDGRIVIAGSDPELRGTDAVPEPMESRSHFYKSDALERLAFEAGFGNVRVERHNLESYARDVGILDEHLSLFDFPARFLLAEKTDRPDRTRDNNGIQ